MRLFKRKPTVEPVAVEYDDETASQVAWTTYHQEAIESIAKATGWSIDDPPSQPIAATLRASQDLKGRPALAVIVHGETIGYIPTDSTTAATPTHAAVVLHKGFKGMGIAARVCVEGRGA